MPLREFVSAGGELIIHAAAHLKNSPTPQLLSLSIQAGHPPDTIFLSIGASLVLPGDSGTTHYKGESGEGQRNK
jgi:hypothetical protein